MARKFFYICAGMFLLALSYDFGTTNARATTSVVAPSEVAVLQGVVANGGMIPLPTYADGTTALEPECHWTVSAALSNGGDQWCFATDALFNPNVGPLPDAGYLNAHPGRLVNVGQGSGLTGPCCIALANYMIIATRGASQPTTALHQSWGQVKARYHATPGMTVTPGADNR